MGYDSDAFRAEIAEVDAQAVIPSSRSRSKAIPYEKHLYGERNLVERLFNRLKQRRAVATRYDKLAVRYHAMVTIAAILLWL